MTSSKYTRFSDWFVIALPARVQPPQIDFPVSRARPEKNCVRLVAPWMSMMAQAAKEIVRQQMQSQE